jgi:cell division protein FtsI/penicillin-binding protein 2
LHKSEFPGVSLFRVSHRVYPLGGKVAPHLLGYVGKALRVRHEEGRASSELVRSLS